MPEAYPKEFREDVVAVARQGRGADRRRSRRTSGSRESCLHNWLKIADVEDGVRPGVTDGRVRRAAGARRSATGCWSRRTRSCAGRRRIFAPRQSAPKMMYPLVLDLAADGVPVAVTCRVLGFSKQAFYAWRANPVTRARLGRRAPDQRRARHPRRRPGVRVPVHRRRARPTPAQGIASGGCGGCARSSGSGRVFAQEAGPEPQGRPAGARRPGRPRLHRRRHRTGCG